MYANTHIANFVDTLNYALFRADLQSCSKSGEDYWTLQFGQTIFTFDTGGGVLQTSSLHFAASHCAPDCKQLLNTHLPEEQL